MRTAIALGIGWIVGFGLLALGAGWFAPLAALAVTLTVMNVSG